MELLTKASLLPANRGVFVPTMGALHEGHAALVRHAAALRRERLLNGPVVVSIFVNPTQFNDLADFARYPKTLDADLQLCRAAGADVVYAPAVEDVYPPGQTPRVPALPKVATEPGLEDRHRPGHFAGVCQVVQRLFDLVRPTHAVFGEKDWQQLAVIAAMVAASGQDIEIVPSATVREQDGLAMSSRNRFLTPSERRAAVASSAALREFAGAASAEVAEAGMADRISRAVGEVEYAVVRRAADLGRLGEGDGAAPVAKRALVAARFGAVRLIDNMPWHGQPAAGAGAEVER
ncbi:MAG: pantoate--beta-alanine ligase [bacterium]